jgi:hypothetical protein
MGAEAAGTTAGVVASLVLGAFFTEGPVLGVVANSASDLTIANPFAATVNFLILTTTKQTGVQTLHTSNNNQTTVVIDVGAATTWTGSYIIGVVA